LRVKPSAEFVVFDHDPQNGHLILTEPMSEPHHQLSAAKP